MPGSDRARALQRRPKPLVLAVTLSVLVAVAALQAADLLWRRDRTLKAGEARAANLAFVLSEYVADSLEVADSALKQLAAQSPRLGGVDAAAEAWAPVLAAAKSAFPGGGSISITDRRGRIVQSSLKALVGQSRADDYIFKTLAAGKDGVLVVDRPFLTVSEPKRYIMPLGRRLTKADGSFDGAVVAVVSPAAYREFFKTVDVGRTGIIWVFHPDGVVLFREPSGGDPINESATANPLLLAARHGSGRGVLHGPVIPGGPPFISAYRATGTPALVVAISLGERELLDDWYAQLRISSVAFAVLTMVAGGLVLIAFNQMDARLRVESALAAAQRQDAARLREANDRLETALEREQRARQEVETASYLKDEFLMTVSHELRTPLTAIYGWVRMLTGRDLPRDQQVKALAAIERNAVAQTRLIEDLLDVSRAISGKLRIEPVAVDVADIVRAALDTTGPAIQAKGIALETSLAPDTGVIQADPERLQQIVWNLMSNAIKFTPEGGRIQVRVRRADAHVEIEVADSGTGIDPAFLPFVFDRFRQGEAGTRRRYGGMGLGLAIVRHLVELHGGTVAASSDGENLGATFRIALPVRLAPALGAATLPVRVDPGSGRAVRLDGLHALVVDDEHDARELFASILESAGATAAAVASAEEALQIIDSQRVDVLLSDIEMPGVDGYELLPLALAAAVARGVELTAIAITAHTRPADRRRAFDAGFQAHLAKPIDPADLVATIDGLRTGKQV